MTTTTDTRTTKAEQPSPTSNADGAHITASGPITVGYVSAASEEDHRQQVEALAAHAARAGINLAHVVEDPHDSVVLSELLEVTDHYGAARMLLPEGTPMAARYRSLTDLLARIGAVCSVVPASSASTAEWLNT